VSESDPELAQAIEHFNRGRALEQRNRLEEAILSYRQAIALKPGLVAGHLNLGVVLYKTGQNEAAAAALKQATTLDPKSALAHSNLGMILEVLNRLDEAESATRRAHELAPDNVTFACNYAIVLGRLQRYAEALPILQRAIQLDPSDAFAHALAGLALLNLGELRQGWKEFEWRDRRWNTRRLAPLTWDGSPLDGKTIILRAEQGLGDTIQFVRYAPMVHDQRGGRVWIECQPQLKDLLKTVHGVEAVYSTQEAVPPADFEIWMMSLADRFQTTVQTIPAAVPYVRHDPARTQKFRAAIGAETGLKVGLVWRGNPNHPDDRLRSMPFATLAPLMLVPAVRLFSLQKDAAPNSPALPDLARLCDDFADLATAMSLMDLVITVDTAPAHLAGALGKPVWTLLANPPEWRWMEQRADSPWYPTMRLFRQSTPGDWSGVVRDVAAALADRVNSNGTT
jgi:Flp pilus assembly protein TadD